MRAKGLQSSKVVAVAFDFILCLQEDTLASNDMRLKKIEVRSKRAELDEDLDS